MLGILEIEIFPENVNTSSRTLPSKDGKPGRTMYEQTAYANLGGKFPVEMTLQLDSAAPFAAGKYTIDPSSFIVNNFGSLELKRYGMKIVPINRKEHTA
ncbi:MAG: hypothetical protein PWP74_890 [Shewanella sp.]|uniref:G5P family DNA-binding protein n=1 Tax=Shewanella sp. 4t3-1-2LB TaxID=2817682 RepID=UPI001F617E6C|nr:G5P family DNA-binding protein [Shewanella sp. 4t3-1-2LB]MDN5369582.1 hypothetical protein [Shewanella sp.]